MMIKPSVINRFIDYYTCLDEQPLTVLAALYHPDAVLIDPLGQHNGLPAIEGYFARLLVNVQQCRFSVDRPLLQDNRCAISWVMHWSHLRIAKGQPLALPGSSFIEVQDDLIVAQHDYYDLGEMLYQHIPVLGVIVRGLKRRLSG